MKHTSPYGHALQFASALLGAALALCLLVPASASAQQSDQSAASQQDQKCTFVDGECVPNYVYVPDFMSQADLKKAIDEHSPDIVIVDTSDPELYKAQHIPGAIDFPYAKNIAAPVPLPRDKTLVLYCECNNDEDSTDVAQQLSLLSYNKVKVLKGGWFKWVDLKYPTVTSDADADAKPAK